MNTFLSHPSLDKSLPRVPADADAYHIELEISIDIDSVTHDQDFYEEVADKILPAEPPLQHTILVLGETGVGKSTLINALANYLTFDKITEIVQSEVLTLIPTCFFLYDVDTDQEIEITSNRLAVTGFDPVEDDRHMNAANNEKHTIGTSSTQHPRTYGFSSSLSSGRRVICRIIDTPGMGDTRGIDQDKKNMDLIIKYIADYPEINGILMLLKPNNSRLTTWFRFCIKELLKSLHKDCVKNIIFMFTNARSTLYRPGDTMPALKKLLGEVKRDSGVDIPVNKSNLFMVDNEAYRYLLARGKVHFTEDEESDFHNSWKKSSETCQRLLDTIADIESHNPEKTIVLYKAREKVLELCKPIVDVGSSITKNTRALSSQVEALGSSESTAENLRSTLKVNYTYADKEYLSHNVLVCSHQDCSKHTKDENGRNVTDHVTKCSEPHYLANSRIGMVGDPLLQNSSMFYERNCRYCGHSFTYHLQINWRIVYRTKQIMNRHATSQINNETEVGRKLQISIQALKYNISRLNREEERLIGSASIYASFVKENGIILFNDAIVEYLNHLIDEAKSSSAEVSHASYGGTSPLQRLSDLKQIYESEKKVILGALAKHTGPIPTQEEMKKALGLIPPEPPRIDISPPTTFTSSNKFEVTTPCLRVFFIFFAGMIFLIVFSASR
ncbi:uncharacterized protein BJ171DRAFT_618835 [Polychytrium aggregatum]|uniref:uncharacterized protein n=1 Tax=Polychytrium aggregatum TaxID=110093 RepID=UPI0022FE691F|nr:uncharacterized protein BJ171DRAFT_618835 [Polychytrium aggregatum]KAI9204709.1 hypothetical protein BJ171DRAFT_618835 [Polychytrium aggregatum]